jgi:L-malate glycosyltransferase
MNPIASPPSTSELAPSVMSTSDSHPSPTFTGPIFLMVNSLETGGTERQFAEITRALRSHKFPVHLGCLLKKGAFSDGLGNITEFNLGGSLYGFQSVRVRLRLRDHLRDLGAKIAHAFDFYANLTLIPAAKLAGIPVIGSHRQLGDLLTPAQFRAQLAMFRLCDRILCNSQAAADRLAQAGLPDRKLVVIGNALPDSAFAGAVPALARRDGILRIGMIARMNAEYKNHRGFLRAAKLVSANFPNLEFVLVGDGPLRSELEKEAQQLGLRDRVTFLGDRRDIPAVLHSLDLSVIPSDSESLSNAMLESMAAGAPVIATAVGGGIELGAHNRALLVPPNDEPALAAALTHAIENPALRSTMARQAKDFVQSNFSVEQISREYESLYADVLDHRQHPAFEQQASAAKLHSKIRVAFVAPSLRYVGGQAVQANLLLKSWKNDTSVAARFLAVDPKFPFGLGWAERVPLLRTLIREPLYFVKLWRELRDADIAHIFSASYTSFLLAPLPAWFIARSLGKKTLINYRSGEARDHLRRSTIARHVLSKTDCLAVPSGYLAQVFREFGLQSEIVPNIIDLSQFHYRERNLVRPHLICTRGFHPYYGIDVVVRAFAEVQTIYPDAQLDLVGGGVLESNIRALVSELSLANVNFLGVASRNEIGKFYDRADIFVNASNLDNMPVSILEAFASGTPVVTTEPEGMEYIVTRERTGLLSPVGDAHALAQNILRVLNDPGLASNLSRNALEESKRYHWAAVREQWLRVYANLMAEAKQSPGDSSRHSIAENEF